MNSRERILAHLAGRPVDRLPLMPITMQFAANLMGVPYRQYATDHRVLVAAQLKVVEQFDFDFVSAISDPAREAADCGARIVLFDDQPPALEEDCARLADKRALAGLKVPDPHGGGRMTDRLRALALFKEKGGGEKLIEGWVEGPMAESADLRGINTIMLDFFDDPSFVRDLFEFVVEMELQFARAQLDAGADIIGVGDAAASLVGPQIYREFVWPYEVRLVNGIHAAGGLVRLHICGNTTQIVGRLGQLGCDIVDLDYPTDMSAARAQMGPDQVLLGNVEPVRVLRNGTPERVAEAVAACHRAAGPRYIVGAGCEVTRDTPEANLRALCDYATHHQP
ncbi:MAG: uroporphyrinogen decarboxylase family protein [Verrucomicrobiota bacterium]|jgi:MtaA/CmuA family methyltransferase